MLEFVTCVLFMGTVAILVRWAFRGETWDVYRYKHSPRMRRELDELNELDL